MANDTDPYVIYLLDPYNVIIIPASTLMMLFTVYGIYIVVFGLFICILLNRRDNPPPKLYLWGTISLFILDTIFVIFDAMGTIHQQIMSLGKSNVLEFGRDINLELRDTLKAVSFGGADFTMVLMMIIADFMLIHRCYVVWGYRRSILYPLVIISVIVNGTLLCGFAFPIKRLPVSQGLFTGDDFAKNGIIIGAAIFNFLLTLLTVGRIWNITYKVQKIIGRSVRPRYKTIIAIITESGILFPSVLLVAVIIDMVTGASEVDLSVLSTQLSGLAPTMIIVRVAYSKPIEDVQEMVSTLRFENSEQQRARSTIV